jgi:hypothetical protein
MPTWPSAVQGAGGVTLSDTLCSLGAITHPYQADAACRLPRPTAADVSVGRAGGHCRHSAGGTDGFWIG